MCSSTSGLLDSKRAQEWIVTTKLGSNNKGEGRQQDPYVYKVYPGELAMAVLLWTSAVHSIVYIHRWSFSFFLILQGACSFC
jgi:beta-mannan synthase